VSAELIALALVSLALGASLLPLLADEEGQSPPNETAGLSAAKDTIVRALRDLDMDLALGRLSTEEHATARDGLEARALEVMTRLESEPVPPVAETTG
jgi:hypothetical protein